MRSATSCPSTAWRGIDPNQIDRCCGRQSAAEQCLVERAAGWARGDNFSCIHDDHLGCKTTNINLVVAHEERRNLPFFEQVLQIDEDALLQIRVERGERLIHQEQLRAGEHRAAEGNALCLTAAESCRDSG